MRALELHLVVVTPEQGRRLVAALQRHYDALLWWNHHTDNEDEQADAANDSVRVQSALMDLTEQIEAAGSAETVTLSLTDRWAAWTLGSLQFCRALPAEQNAFSGFDLDDLRRADVAVDAACRIRGQRELQCGEMLLHLLSDMHA